MQSARSVIGVEFSSISGICILILLNMTVLSFHVHCNWSQLVSKLSVKLPWLNFQIHSFLKNPCRPVLGLTWGFEVHRGQELKAVVLWQCTHVRIVFTTVHFKHLSLHCYLHSYIWVFQITIWSLVPHCGAELAILHGFCLVFMVTYAGVGHQLCDGTGLLTCTWARVLCIGLFFLRYSVLSSDWHLIQLS
jgi:hypothetical protein